MSRFPIRRLATVADKVPPEPGYDDNRIALESIEAWVGKLTVHDGNSDPGEGSRFERNDILFGKLRPYLAKAWVADRSGAYYGDFVNIRPRGAMDAHFIGYALRTPQFIDAATALSSGSKMPRTEWASLREIGVPVPPLRHQRSIAGYLDHETAEIDALTEDLETARKLSAERLAATRDSMLVEAAGTPTPLRRFIQNVDQGESPVASTAAAEPGEKGVLKAGCTNFGRFDLTANKRLPEDLLLREESRIREGDLLVTRASGSIRHVGSAAIVEHLDRNLYLSDKIYRLHPLPRHSASYIALALQARPLRDALELKISGAEGLARNISLSTLLGLPIPLVDRAREEDIVARYGASADTFHASNVDLTRAITLAKERRAALITAAVTGQIDVTAKRRPAAEQLEDDIKELS